MAFFFTSKLGYSGELRTDSILPTRVGSLCEGRFDTGGEERRPGRWSLHRRQLFEYRYGITE